MCRFLSSNYNIVLFSAMRYGLIASGYKFGESTMVREKVGFLRTPMDRAYLYILPSDPDKTHQARTEQPGGSREGSDGIGDHHVVSENT